MAPLATAYSGPPKLTLARAFTEWTLDPWMLALVLILGGGYLAALRRKPDWPMAFGKVKAQGIAYPSCSTRRLPERLPLLEHLRVLKIGGQIVDRMGRPVEVDDHDDLRRARQIAARC